MSQRLAPGDEILIPRYHDGPASTAREAKVLRSIAFAEVFEVESVNDVTGAVEKGVVAARTGHDTLWVVREFAP